MYFLYIIIFFYFTLIIIIMFIIKAEHYIISLFLHSPENNEKTKEPNKGWIKDYNTTNTYAIYFMGFF